MKKTALILAALAAGVSVRADEAKKTYSVTSDFTYASDYVFRGVKDAGSSFQPSVEVTSEGFALGLWTNQPIVKHTNNEIDLYGNYTYKVNDALSLEGVATYYWYPEADSSIGQTNHSLENGIGATYTIKGFSPSLYYYYDYNLHANTLQGSVGYSVPLEAIGSSLDLSGYLGTVESRNALPNALKRIKESYNYYGADASIPYKLSDTAKVAAGVHYARNENLGGQVAGTPRDRVWFTLSATIGF
jgi:uncharacterized protein (TIGR02001 family)